MKTITVYQFKDLKKEIQKAVYFHVVNETVEGQLEVLNFLLDRGDVSEAEYYKTLGCSKYYAEVTSWFIPACYFQHNKSYIHHLVKEDIDNMLFNEAGKIIERGQ